MVLSSSQLAGIALLSIGCLSCIAGYISPFWEYEITYEPVKMEAGAGLIFGCVKSKALNVDKCEVLKWNLDMKDDIYFKAVRVLMGSSLLFILTGTIAGLVSCCRRHSMSSIFFEGMMAIFAGVTGIAGVATFAACSKGSSTVTQVNMPIDKGWAFYLSAASCSFVLLMGILALMAPKSQSKYITSTTSHYGIPNQGYNMDPQKNSYGY